jgi:hypothetical protein
MTSVPQVLEAVFQTVIEGSFTALLASICGLGIWAIYNTVTGKRP